MNAPQATFDPSPCVEGLARVVEVEDDIAWLEPEQTTSCGSCASSAACGGGATGIGTVASRLAARRFPIENPVGPLALRPGERVVVGVSRRALLNAALVAYGLPMLGAIVAGGLAQAQWGEDVSTMICMAAGLAIGLLVARGAARRLSDRGQLAPRLLRRARPGETCATAKD